MTREEAIEVIKQDIPCEHDTDLIEALEMAISALEQVTKIRKAVMEIIKAHMDGEDKNTKAVLSDVMDSVRETLEQEPCEECKYKTFTELYFHTDPEMVEQEPCDDAISREAVIEWLKDKDIIKLSSQEEAARRELNALPSVTQKSETVTEFADRCRECGARYGKLLKQKSGRWIVGRIFPTKVYDENLIEYRCSECDRAIRCTESQLVNYPYCHCGAKMVEPQESEDKK